jgi:hypothetical protein
MTETATSKNGLPIRLTDERWSHITEEHAELAGFRYEVLDAIANPERIVARGRWRTPRDASTTRW